MTKYIVKRVLRSLITMFIIITVLFALLRMMPIEGYFENFDKMTDVQIQAKLNTLGLNDPLHEQLLRFYQQIFRGDLGTSNKYRIGVSINEIIAEKKSEKGGFIILCDGIEDVHNLGSILRVAECAGADGVVIAAGSLYFAGALRTQLGLAWR